MSTKDDDPDANEAWLRIADHGPAHAIVAASEFQTTTARWLRWRLVRPPGQDNDATPVFRLWVRVLPSTEPGRGLP